MTFRARVHKILMGIEEMLVEKNESYGDSALNPVRVFSKASAEEQILVRIDDKLSRLARGKAAGEDVLRDLVGYLVLLMIVRAKRKRTKRQKVKLIVEGEEFDMRNVKIDWAVQR